jgi:hypothetical protein
MIAVSLLYLVICECPHHLAAGDMLLPDGTVFNNGDVAWVLASTALVFIMIPGVGFFYCTSSFHFLSSIRSHHTAGLLRRKNALSMIWLSMMCLAVVSFQWWLWGYSLAFSDGASSFIGDLKYFALRGVVEAPSVEGTRVPSIVYCIYQLTFAAITYVRLASPTTRLMWNTQTITCSRRRCGAYQTWADHSLCISLGNPRLRCVA